MMRDCWMDGWKHWRRAIVLAGLLGTVAAAQPTYFVHEGSLLRFDGASRTTEVAASADVAVGEFLGLADGDRPVVKLRTVDDHTHDQTCSHEHDPSLADIAILGSDGQIETLLAGNAFRAFPSPSGKLMAVIDADYSIAIVDGDTRTPIDIAERTVLAAWSPDETRLCLTVYPPDWTFDAPSRAESPDDFLRLINNDLILYDLRTNTAEQLTTHEGYDYGAIFAPDGESVLFISSRSGRGAFYRLDLEAKQVTQLTNLEPDSYDIPVGRSQTIVWLEGTDSIAYEAQETPYLSTIRVLGSDGTRARNLGLGTQPRPIRGGAGLAFLANDGMPTLRTMED